MRSLAAAAMALLLVSAGCGASSSSGVERRSRQRLSTELQRSITLAGMRAHLDALQRIADANGGHRAAGTAGYNASVRYVRTQLTRAGLRVRLQSFPYVRFVEELERGRQLAPTERDLARQAFEYSGSGKVRGQVVAAGDGCQPGDFDAVAGKIALVRRGACFFAVKAGNAARAGAAAAIVFNNEAGPLTGTLAGPGISIPVVGVTREVGSTLAGATVEVEVRARTVRTTVQNVIADAPRALRAPTLVVGAHLDSVTAGAGIDDNGTGVAALLELAEALQRLEPRHHVRFGFWGAEESGLHGSRAYVRVAANRRAVSGYLNFDMLGARRYTRGIYRGPFANVFERYFAARGLRSETIDIEGRSDHASFDAVGIATGGLFSGGDACYHRPCDRVPNVNLRGLDELADAAAHAVAILEPR